MIFSRVVEKEGKIVVWGRLESQQCYRDLATFHYNPLVESSKERAKFLATQFVELMPKMDEKFKEEKEKVLEVEVIIRDGDAVISPIIPQSPSPLELEIQTISLREFRRYLVYTTRLVGNIKAKYVVRNGCWKFKELV